MANKLIYHSLIKKCEEYVKFANDFDEKSEQRLRYFAATGEKLYYVGMMQVDVPFQWLAYVFLAGDQETRVFLSVGKTIFISDKEIGAKYIVKEVKSKVYVLE